MRIPKSYTSILTLAIPVIISQVGQVVVTLVDTMMVGQLGAVPLAGVSFANALFMPVMVIGLGIAMGVTPLASRAFVRKDTSRLKSLIKNSALLNTMLGFALAIILSTLTVGMGLMGQDPDVVAVATPYSFVMAISLIPLMWFYTARQFLEGLGNTSWAMIITITANLVNVGLNFVLIYGLLGMPALGALGAGIATLIARFLQVVLFIVLFRYQEKFGLYFRGWNVVKFCRFRLLRLWRLGFPIAMQIGIECLGMSAMAIAIGTLGAEVLAGHQVAMNMPTLAFMFVTGLANATTIIVARDYQLKLYDSVRTTLRSSLVMVTVIMIFTSSMFVLFAYPIASLFSPDPAVQAIAAHLLFFGALFQISDGIQGVTLGALRGLLDVKRPMYYALAAYIFVGAPAGYLCGFVLEMGAGGVWIGFISALTTLAVMYVRRFRHFISAH